MTSIRIDHDDYDDNDDDDEDVYCHKSIRQYRTGRYLRLDHTATNVDQRENDTSVFGKSGR